MYPRKYNSDKFLCSYKSMWGNRTLYFCRIFFIVLLTEVSSVHPTLDTHIYINNIESIRIIRRKEIWQTRRGGQSTKRIFRGNRDSIWEQIWGISGSFMQAGSIIKGNGGYIQIWDTKAICKRVIESVIKSTIVVLQY